MNMVAKEKKRVNFLFLRGAETLSHSHPLVGKGRDPKGCACAMGQGTSKGGASRRQKGRGGCAGAVIVESAHQEVSPRRGASSPRKERERTRKRVGTVERRSNGRSLQPVEREESVHRISNHCRVCGGQRSGGGASSQIKGREEVRKRSGANIPMKRSHS